MELFMKVLVSFNQKLLHQESKTMFILQQVSVLCRVLQSISSHAAPSRPIKLSDAQESNSGCLSIRTLVSCPRLLDGSRTETPRAIRHSQARYPTNVRYATERSAATT